VTAWVTAGTLRPLPAMIPSNRAGVVLSRAIVAGGLAAFSPRLAGTGIELVDERTADARLRGEWVRAPGAVRDDAVILYGKIATSLPTVERLAHVLDPLEGTVDRLGRFVDHLPQRRRGRPDDARPLPGSRADRVLP